jgi:aldehyde:ferredoxin oxidoreductase
MGSKLLKGIAIQGRSPVQAVDDGHFREARRSVNRAIASRRDWAQRRRAEGTTTSMEILQDYGMLPTRNWQQGSFEGFSRLAPGAHQPDVPWRGESAACAASCPAPCARRYEVTDGLYAGAESTGPDYETLYAFGSNCGIDRFDSIVAADRLCDELGLDTISAGVTIGFIMECAARGLLPGDMALLGPSFGDHQAVVALLPQLAHRQGLGEWLAEGAQRCSEMLGQGTEVFAMHAKGLELGGWGCRGTYGQALQYALGSRGGCHHDLGLPAKSEYALPESTTVEGKGDLVLHTGAERIALDSAIICSFACQYIDLETVADLLAAVTGHPFDAALLETIGERVLNVERLLNVREGIDREADRLPGRLQHDPLPDGPRRGAIVPLEPLKTDFYGAAGWDETTGIPTPATLERLGLSDLSSTLAAAGASSRHRKTYDEEGKTASADA